VAGFDLTHILLDDIAIQFPQLKMIVAHLGHPWIGETLVLIRKHPNLYSDISATLQEFNTTTGPLSRELCLTPLQPEDGYLRVPQGPGLGVEVDESVINKYRVA
jgi:hypothetical protein